MRVWLGDSHYFDFPVIPRPRKSPAAAARDAHTDSEKEDDQGSSVPRMNLPPLPPPPTSVKRGSLDQASDARKKTKA
jgi:hypothetical protein